METISHENGGEGGIRTRETESFCLPALQAGAFNQLSHLSAKLNGGGESEIRTHEAGATRLLAFEASAFNHSAISPLGLIFICSLYSVSTLILVA